jgi:L-histidine N-alpha-methyltransferase
MRPTSLTTPTGVTIEVHLGPDEWADAIRHDTAAGLAATPKEIPPTWFYDDRGCELFEAITRLPEYYPTRTERSILAARAGDIADLTGADTLVELGAGTSEKTRLLLDALDDAGHLKRFVPFDVAETTLVATAEAIAEEYPTVTVTGVVGDFRRHLGELPRAGRRLVAFLGGTIGNLRPRQRAVLLGELAASLQPGDALLLGTDLVKDPARLEAAYDDAQGVTAEFNRNVLRVLNRELGADFRVLNRELGADFEPSRWRHVARFDEVDEWIEMRLRSVGDQTVHVPALGLTVAFADGEDLRTEISAKFRRSTVRAELEVAGLTPVEWWTDPAGDFALSLAVK